MYASISQPRTQTVVVTPDDLRKLDNSFRTFGGEPTYEAECADQITRRFSTLQELVDFENPPNKEIRILRMKVSTPRNKSSAVISFENTTLTPTPTKVTSGSSQSARSNIWIAIEGDEARVIKLLHDIEDRLVAMKPRYSFVSRLDPLLTAFLPFLVALLTQILFVQGNSGEKSKTLTIGDSTFWTLVFIIVPPFLLGFLLWYGQRKLYPMASFTIGQGEKRFSDKDYVSTVIIIGLGVSLLASLMAAPILILLRLNP